MDTLRKRFPWLTAAEQAWLRAELMRRAALGFEQAELWRDAAGCWASLGEHGRAGELYARGEDLGAAASALLAAGRYAQALDLYRRWEGSLLEGDVVNRVQALLGQATCHRLGAGREGAADELSRPAGQGAYRRARALLEAEGQRDGWATARCCAALGEYGVRLGRFDLAQEGYERALEHLEGTVAGREKVTVGEAYLQTLRLRDDRLLVGSVEERLAGWGELEETDREYQPPTYEQLVERSQQIRPLRALEGHTERVYNAVYSVAFSPDGQLLASGSYDHTVRLWEVGMGRSLWTLGGHTGTVYSVAFSPDGQLLASGSYDHTVRLWDISTGNNARAATGQPLRTLEGHGGCVNSVAFSANGQLLASGSSDNTVWLWDISTALNAGVDDGREVRTLEGHSGRVYSVDFSPDGQLLASGGRKTVRVWEVHSGRQVHVLPEHSGEVTGVAFSPDGRLLASDYTDSKVRLWNVKTGRAEIEFEPGETDSKMYVNTLAWSPDGTVLICRWQESKVGHLSFWHIASRKLIHRFRETQESASSWSTRALALSPDGQILTSYARDTVNTIQLWDISALGLGFQR